MKAISESVVAAAAAVDGHEPIPVCDTCGEQRGVAIPPDLYWVFGRGYREAPCRCVKEARGDESILPPEERVRRERARAERERARQVDALLAGAGIPPIHADATFANLNLDGLDREQASQLRGAVDVCRRYVASRASSSLVLMGTAGTAKTHLAAASLNALIRDLLIPGMFWNWTVRWAEIRRHRVAGRHDEAEAMLERAATVPVLVLDDVGITTLEANQLERAYEIVEARYEAGLPFVVTTNANRAELDRALSTRIVDRLFEAKHTIKVTLTGTSWRTRS